MMHGWWDYGPAPWFGFGPLWMIIVVAVAVILVAWAIKSAGRQSSAPLQAASPLDILKERFARGEINRTEYEERKQVLSH